MELPLPNSNRRNRMTPFGEIVAVGARGTLMGNRGDLHAKDGNLGPIWRLRRWITCTLEETNGQRVTFDRPGFYYPLFFADEAVAFAAGHRPCAQCRRDAYNRFRECFRAASGTPSDAALSADEMDRRLHDERIDQAGKQVTFRANLSRLPDGTFATRDNAPSVPLLWWRNQLHPWTHPSYLSPMDVSPKEFVTVLTPAPIVSVYRAGYSPAVGLVGNGFPRT